MKFAQSLTLVAMLGLAACGTPQKAIQSAARAPAVSTEGTITARGNFVGASRHETSGTAEIVKTDAGWVISLGRDFSLDGGPDPVVALGNGGTWDASTKSGSLIKLRGSQAYLLPASVDVGKYRQIHVWCEEFSVPLGYADLNLL